MQVEDPDQGTYLMPVVWYFAPPGAKTFYGLNAFTSGIWDRDSPALPPRLGEQPPYDFPYYRGTNVWGYLGQCRIGSDQAFAGGLSAAELAAPPEPIPACCKNPTSPLLFFLRLDRTPPQSLLPSGYVGAWHNQGDPADVGLLDTVPGTAQGFITYNVLGNLGFNQVNAVKQYLSAPLPSFDFPADTWKVAVGFDASTAFGAHAHLSVALFVIDGATGAVRSVLRPVTDALDTTPFSAAEWGLGFELAALSGFAQGGDYLCLELGWHVSALPHFPQPWRFNGSFFDSGAIPIPLGTNLNDDAMSVLQYPSEPEDLDVQTGMVVPFAGVGVPAGYLLCDGSAYPIGSFPALYASIGLTYGAAPPGQFRVPDLQDRVPIGTSPGGLGVDRPTARALGGSGGEESHQLITNELAAHTHPITDPGHIHPPDNFPMVVGDGLQFAVAGTDVQAGIGIDAVTGSAVTGVTASATGADVPHNTMQPFLTVAWLIKT